MTSDHDIIVGIDLGTTNSLVAFCDEAGPRVLCDDDDQAKLPSVLTLQGRHAVRIGREAKAHAVEQPVHTVYSIKRLMGRGYDELQASGELSHLPYRIVKRAGDEAGQDIAAVEIDDEILTPQEISAMILRRLADQAERRLGRKVTRAVVTVPAYFDDAQRQATRDAGRIAGLEIVRIINEPTAAALAYGLGVGHEKPRPSAGTPGLSLAGQSCADESAQGIDAREPKREGESLVAVYDLGGGTFDVSILKLIGDVFEVQSTHGDTCLGGDDFDRAIIQLVEREVREQFGIDIDAPATRQALRTFAENVKIRLSTEPAATIEIDFGGREPYRRTLTRDELERMIAPLVDRTIDACRRALRDAKVAMPRMIDRVVLVGGSTRAPLVRRKVAELFQREPYTALDPDEVVALGASVQAAILAGTRRDALLLDVIPLSLGIETMGGAMGKLILRNTRLPCQASERFSTFVDGQTNVKINVLQGERELARDCRSLGEFDLRDIPPMPAGIPKILVSFLVDENGILDVSAREERSGQEASIQIIPAHGLTTEEVNRMERESYEHAREDMTAHRLIDLRNQVAFDTDKAEQMLDRVGDSMPAKERAAVEAALRELRELARGCDDAERLHAALTEFDRMTVPLAERAITRTLQEGDRNDAGAPPGDAE